jgi:branched-chain amino acid transport system ATP-binding protein
VSRVLLEVRDVVAGYGLGQVLHGVSLRVARGEAVALLGRNGAGKSTTLKAIMGLVPVAAGSVVLDGEDLTGAAPYARARRGMGYVPQERRIFPALSVWENLEAGRRPGAGGWSLARVLEVFPALAPLLRRAAGTLSGGEQQMLAIGRTLMGSPSLLLLDEPSEGLAPQLVKSLADQVLLLKRNGLSILLSEQNLRFTLGVSDRAYVIEKGGIHYEGTVADLTANAEVRRRYLMV